MSMYICHCERVFCVLLQLSTSHQTFSGKSLPTNSVKQANDIKTTYTALPPSQLCCTDAAKRDVAIAGPMARRMDAASCARPLVAPREYLSGAAAETYKKVDPVFHLSDHACRDDPVSAEEHTDHRPYRLRSTERAGE